MEIKRITIKKSSRFRTLNIPIAWLKKVQPRNGDELVIHDEGSRLVLELERKD